MCVCVCVVCVARVKRGLDWRCIPPPSPAHHSLLSLPPSNPLRSPSARTRLVRFAVVVHHLLLIDFLPPRLVCSCILMTGSAWSPPAWWRQQAGSLASVFPLQLSGYAMANSWDLGVQPLAAPCLLVLLFLLALSCRAVLWDVGWTSNITRVLFLPVHTAHVPALPVAVADSAM